MEQLEESPIEAQIFAVRTALILLASALEDRFDPGVLRERLEFLIHEADMRGADLRFTETSQLLTTMMKNLGATAPLQAEPRLREITRDQA